MNKEAKAGGSVKIIIGGDIVPMARSLDDFCSGNAGRIFGQFVDIFRRSDLVIANLECPLSDRKNPIDKVGRNLIAPTNSIMGIKEAGIGLLNLANNHIMDQGALGLSSTIEACSKNGIKTLGAGKNIAEASINFIKRIGDINISIHSCAESEFSIADRMKYGANPISAIEIWRRQKKEQKESFGIYLLHAGREHYPYPSPNLQKLCRFIIEQGVKVVICQHSHCAGTYEEYEDGLIVYGQGNFVFDEYPRKASKWYEGFLIELDIKNNTYFEYNLLPYIQYREKDCVDALNNTAKDTFLCQLKDRSSILQDAEQVEKKWRDHCAEYKYKYFSILRGHGKILKLLNLIFHFTDLAYRKRSLLSVLKIRCETHKEVLETILKMENE